MSISALVLSAIVVAPRPAPVRIAPRPAPARVTPHQEPARPAPVIVPGHVSGKCDDKKEKCK